MNRPTLPRPAPARRRERSARATTGRQAAWALSLTLALGLAACNSEPTNHDGGVVGVPVAPPGGSHSTATPGRTEAKPVQVSKPETDSEALLAEFRAAIDAWVAALDADDAETLQSFTVTDEFLEDNLTPGSSRILSGTLVAKNRHVITELRKIASGKDVRVLGWTPGKPSHTQVGSSIFVNSVLIIPASLVEISIGGIPVELEFRQAVRADGAWRVLEVKVKS